MVSTPKKPRPQTGRDAGSSTDPADEVYIHLSERDRDTVLETIEADAQPNEALKCLARRYKERYG